MTSAVILAFSVVLDIIFSQFYYVGYFNDDAYYVLGAQSLLQGRYALLSDPATPPMTLFPPGFPLFLAPFTALLAPHWGALKLAAIAVTVTTGIASARLFKPWLSSAGLIIFLAAYAFNPQIAKASSWVMSDLFFTLLVLAVFLLLRRSLERETSTTAWLAGTLLGWAMIVRPIGLVLAVAVAGGLFYGRRWRTAARSLPLGFSIWLGLVLRNYSLSHSPSGYWPRFKESVSTLEHLPAMLDNVQRVANLFFVDTPFGIHLPYSPWGWALNAILVAAAVFLLARGFLAVAAKSAQDKILAVSMLLYGLGCFAVQASWAAIDVRYALPILPFFFAFLIVGVCTVARRPGQEARWTKGLAALAALSIILGNVSALRRARSLAGQPPRRFPAKTIEWIREHIPADAVLLSWHASVIYMYTQRHAVTGAHVRVNDQEEFRYALLKEGITHVLDEPLTPLYRPRDSAQPVDLIRQRGIWAASAPKAFRPLFNDAADATAVYEVVGDASFTKAFELYLAARQDLQSSNIEKGLRGLEAALEARPDLLKALNAYGAACLLSGKHLAAGEAKLKQALKVEPHYFWAWLNLSRLYRKTGRIPQAKDALNHALADIAGFPNLIEMRPVLSRERAELEAL